ncbi:hypothetical protein ABIE85_007142 [Bradyrhizobium diazoefficiens]
MRFGKSGGVIALDNTRKLFCANRATDSALVSGSRTASFEVRIYRRRREWDSLPRCREFAKTAEK